MSRVLFLLCLASSSLLAQTFIGGCKSFPDDSIYNVRIDNLPVHSQSANWLSSITGYGLSAQPEFIHNVVSTSNVQFRSMKYFYGAPSDVVAFPSDISAHRRENGRLAYAGDGADHHTLTVTTGVNPCHFYELYNEVITPTDTYNCQNGSRGCNAQSGDDYTPNSYNIVAGTDAAGLPQYLVLRLDEIKNNTIHHPSRFTVARGYIQASWAGTPNLWPATGSNGWGGPNTLPFGARLRLRSNFNMSGYSVYAQRILTSLQRYGLMLADSGTTGGVQTDTDIYQDPSVASAVFEAFSNLTFANFDVVDESHLMVQPTSSQVSTPITPSSNIAVGLQNPQMSAIVTGTSYSYNFGANAWVVGSSDTQMSWKLVSGPGSVTTSGVYTFPSTVSTVTAVTLQVTPLANPSATNYQYILLYPVSSDGAFRTAMGGQFVDGYHFTWWSQAGLETGIMVPYSGDYPSWISLAGNPEQAIYQSGAYTYGADVDWQFIVPNRQYKLRMLFGQNYGGCQPWAVLCSIDPQSKSPLAIGADSTILSSWYQWGSQVNDRSAEPWDFDSTVTVTDNVLNVWMGRTNPDFDTYYGAPQISGLEVIPQGSLGVVHFN